MWVTYVAPFEKLYLRRVCKSLIRRCAKTRDREFRKQMVLERWVAHRGSILNRPRRGIDCLFPVPPSSSREPPAIVVLVALHRESTLHVSRRCEFDEVFLGLA